MLPKFAHARRELRRARVSAALGAPLGSDVVSSNRDRLLSLLGASSVAGSLSFEQLGDDDIETVISIAVATVNDSADDAAIVLLVCLKVLAENGQFARMTFLAQRLGDVARRFAPSRPYWALALTAFSDSLTNKRAKALQDLNERLGVGRDLGAPDRRAHTEQQLEDVVCAAALQVVLSGADAEFAGEVRDRSLARGDGSALAFLDAVIAWSAAVEVARPTSVLPAVDPIFAEGRLAGYVSGVRVPALFPSQMRALSAGVTFDENRMVSLPTSSGKTLLAELRIVATLTRNPGSRAIYVAPYRLLSRQVERQLRSGLRRAGFEIRDLGSGYSPSSLPAGESANVIVCTPERLDGLLRLAVSGAEGSAEAAAFIESCSVLVFDELHLIGRSGRGPRFELILARLRMRSPGLRILGLAAAAHGSHELSEWLGDEVRLPASGRPTGTLELVWQKDGVVKQRAHRAQPTTVMEMPRKTAIDDAAALMLRFSDEYLPVLAICTQRQRAESLAKKVLNRHVAQGEQWRNKLSDADLHTLSDGVQEVRSLMGDDHPLARMMESGVAFHHAGVPTHALEQIEKLARCGLLRYVCATTTVAEGADLPFRVVVIPHLDFPGRSRRLERDLYLNIIGRAGRANVAVEGMVFILDSDARNLDGIVTNSLWRTAAYDVLRGQLSNVVVAPSSVEDWNDYANVESQVLAWLTDRSSYVEHQALALSQRTFSFHQGNYEEKARVHAIIGETLRRLEQDGYAVAGSPLIVTPIGNVAQLTGLSMAAVTRLNAAVGRGLSGWLAELPGVTEVATDVAQQLARLVFEAPEVFQHSLWFRRNAKGNLAWPELHRFAYRGGAEHTNSPDYQLDITLFAKWIMGASYSELASIANIAPHASSLFGGNDQSKRVSDATEYVGKLTYPAAWVWSGVQIVAGDLGKQFPGFLRGAIEYGVPTETAVQLIERGRLTRPAAMTIANMAGPEWTTAIDWLLRDGNVAEAGLLLTNADGGRLRDLQVAIELDS